MTTSAHEGSMPTPGRGPKARALNVLLPRAAEVATWARSKAERLGRMALLTHKDPRAQPKAYTRARTPLNELDLVHYGPDRSMGATKLPIPGKYKAVALTAITAAGIEVLERHQDTTDKRPVVLWKLCDTAMQAVLDPHDVDKLLHQMQPQLDMLVGGHPDGLDTGLGIMDVETGTVETNSDWLERGTRVPIERLPADAVIW